VRFWRASSASGVSGATSTTLCHIRSVSLGVEVPKVQIGCRIVGRQAYGGLILFDGILIPVHLGVDDAEIAVIERHAGREVQRGLEFARGLGILFLFVKTHPARVMFFGRVRLRRVGARSSLRNSELPGGGLCGQALQRATAAPAVHPLRHHEAAAVRAETSLTVTAAGTEGIVRRDRLAASPTQEAFRIGGGSAAVRAELRVKQDGPPAVTAHLVL
jgi:hypothetical protein